MQQGGLSAARPAALNSPGVRLPRATRQLISDGLRSRTDERRATQVDVVVHALNRMLELGRPICVCIA